MNRSRDLEGVHGTKNAFDLGSEPGCQIAQISDKRWGAATEDGVDARVHGVFPLLMGMEREDRCE